MNSDLCAVSFNQREKSKVSSKSSRVSRDYSSGLGERNFLLANQKEDVPKKGRKMGRNLQGLHKQ